MASTLHKYPGIDLPLRYLVQNEEGGAGIEFYRCGSFEAAAGSLSELIQVREVAMLLLMDRLTDKPNWHKKVFDEAIVAKWRHEALTQDETTMYEEIVAGKNIPMPQRTRIINEATFDYCIAELKCKAAYFEETGLVFTLNSSQGSAEYPCFNTAIKADSLVNNELQQGLKAAFEKLRAEQAAEPDWHPGSNDMVQDLVHPSMYPFVYGESRFIPEEAVRVVDAVERWSGKGETVQALLEGDEEEGELIDRDYWSKKYQWLPANLAFQDDGSVRFTSYVNNLHPQKHTETYRLLEKLIDTAIPTWEHVLSGKAITPSSNAPERLEQPPRVYEENEDDVWEKLDPVVIAEHEAEDGPIDYSERELPCDDDEWEDDEEMGLTAAEVKEQEIQRLKWKDIRDPTLMEPLEFEPHTYKVEQTLRERFKDTGLQVIVKMASIELTPENPDFPMGGWHIEGQMNEHIVATALYYLDSENVTPSELSFRMATSSQQDGLQSRVAQNMDTLYQRIYGTNLSWGPGSETVQTYGSVATPEGRLLAFPNVFQHRVSSFSLQDRTKPGHRRFVALWLVDPLRRVVSTANVPPQQFNWWAEAVFGNEAKTAGEMPPEVFQLLLEKGADKAVKPSEELLQSMRNRLPAEVMEMVRREAVPGGLMTAEQARQHRLALMEERSAFVRTSEKKAWKNRYSFCEH
ncbi:uncharacterized protein B0H64DRAFT_424789 [Chaetomium fimeti]|uniref:Uncharacterized protein n=1 Tax=Chaetomium fimeti TaxID=1854472 RepID=A0AAE0LSN9_9PEZI|nr:hypothetical protein B0H64DRAFT_424789 [Chaetomium fimeti]